MPSNTRLLYLLPELAYNVELVPTKKPNTFAIKDFHQVNGKFLDENELKAENFEKLLEKLDEGDYTLILPDYLFTNT
ncbi:MAG: hypothetical protein R6W85_07785, partial [Gillisia sp.]